MTTNYPHISHHGAVTGVTGSCHELHINKENSVLIDCGIFQGSDSSPHNKADSHHLELDFSIKHVQALIVTHCHIDHAGRIPWLVAAGFNKPIYCSQPTAKLLPLMLEDAAKIGITRDKKLIKKLVQTVEELIQPIAYKQWTTVHNDLKIRLQRAGHILGSAYIECDTHHNNKPTRTIFSGDLGAPHAPLLPEPKAPKKCTTLVIESTYGDKLHSSREDRKDRLKALIEHCFEDRGAVLIPAFSLGRTQELMYEFEQIIHENKEEWSEIAVIIDSPLASRFTTVYRELKHFWDEEAQSIRQQNRYPLTFKQLHTVETYDQHKKTINYLAKSGLPTIVIAASGMCNGGRIMGYLKALLEDKRTDILFTGYQAKNSIGRRIQTYGPRNGYIELDGQRYTINAQVHTIGGYSAHADQQDLINFAAAMDSNLEEVRVVHGDERAKKTLQQKLQTLHPNANVIIPTK
jgi:metallo-beta-lactamase family protein